MPDPARRKCSVCGAQRPVTELTQYTAAPKSQSGSRTYSDVWYCSDRNHNLSGVARMATRQRP